MLEKQSIINGQYNRFLSNSSGKQLLKDIFLKKLYAMRSQQSLSDKQKIQFGQTEQFLNLVRNCLPISLALVSDVSLKILIDFQKLSLFSKIIFILRSLFWPSQSTSFWWATSQALFSLLSFGLFSFQHFNLISG